MTRNSGAEATADGFGAESLSYRCPALSPAGAAGPAPFTPGVRRPTPARVYDPKGRRLPEHGGEFIFGALVVWGTEPRR
ncbi:hypothetical protein [Streptomyces chattanoogensis]|uniref:hypothetical protein n=1 Tax=Streptomyces chattanoogensis TaxID=66876 RepID=UPI00369708AB